MSGLEADAPGGGDAPVGAETETEATGETVGEAKWTALKELERRFPGLEKSDVEFVVLAEGERGLLGVGFVAARVAARVVRLPQASAAADAATGSEAARRLRALLERIREGLGVDVTVSVSGDPHSLTATFHGPDLGLVIGKHGQTIDAIQYLATAVLGRDALERVDVVVDAAGYRERRRSALEALADRAATDVAATGKPVELDPMTAAERKVVHLRLRERSDVVTISEGREPNRYIVVRPGE
jgi:spoIIIJ-associated protein